MMKDRKSQRCFKCKEKKPKSEYSDNEWNRARQSKATCKACVRKAADPKPASKEHDQQPIPSDVDPSSLRLYAAPSGKWMKASCLIEPAKGMVAIAPMFDNTKQDMILVETPC